MAESTLSFVGQFGNKAVLKIDGKQRLLIPGETSPEGVKLLSVTSNGAVIEHQGETRELGHGAISATPGEAQNDIEVILWADKSGHFETPGAINGQLVNFLVDTGATVVAMNEITARKLGIDFRYSGKPGTVATASGLAVAYDIRLDSVKVGEIELRNVDASVLEGGFPLQVLLGMSFLSHLEIQRKGNSLRLIKNP